MQVLLSRILALLLVALVTACAELPKISGVSQSSPEALQHYDKGLEHYRDKSFELARNDFDAAIATGSLNSSDLVIAHKHLAFIHCLNGREVPCREQFQLALKTNADFDLAANEASHPSWGPVWLSVKNEMEDQRAVKNADSPNATPAQRELGKGIKEYDAGRYQETINAMQAALKQGLATRGDEIRAHRFMAFSYCLTQHNKECAAEFHAIFSLDPAFVLVPSEAGHPSWSSIYGKELAAAKRLQKK